MPISRLLPLKIIAPGFFGVNTKQNVTGDLHWASEALNCVIDKRGRLGVRKGRKTLTTTPIAGTPNVTAMFEQVADDGTLTIVSAASDKLYTGTTTLTDVTGTAASVTGITEAHWQFQNISGKLVGFQAGHDPVIRRAGDFSLLQQEISDWQPTTAYSIGDVVKATSGNETLYFHATTGGTSGGVEPTWTTTVGGTTSDGTVTWTTRKFPNGNICHSAFGRIWVTSDGDDSQIEFSDTLLPHKFRGGLGGILDLTTVWGGDRIIAISSTEDLLIIFGEKTILIYTGTSDPTTMTLFEKIEGVGCVARDSVAQAGKDLVFLSDSGVRALSRTIEGGKQPMSDISTHVRESILETLSAEAPKNIKGVYHEPEGFYILAFPGLSTPLEWVFDTKFPNPDQTPKITRWRGFNSKALLSSRDRKLYIGHEGVVAEYDGFNDGATDTYDVIYRSTWVDFTGSQQQLVGSPVVGRFKIPKRWRTSFVTGKAYSVTFVWGFDYREALHSTQVVLVQTADVSEWGSAEWAIGEWSGGDIFSEGVHSPNGFGEVMKIGYNVTIDGVDLSAQSIDIMAKIGRLR